ncbi:unnamed protein product [Mytilus edulis]|uniref:Reverse transcriptase n=1 Tax=Mytilus edulis TaxID=6550 RepID=A0A8S3QFE9_MYTED|nr:unnamed protein product [Mytilus edulis]
MDDSGEVIIAINHSFQEENDGEITIPLNEQKVDSVDYAEQTISHDKEQNLFMNELRNLKRKPVEVGLRGRSQAGTEWPKSIKINESLANNEGLFVRAKINDKCLAFLVDTGANVTILSKKFIDEINPSLLPKMNPVNINLITATGDSAPFIGQVDVEICLGNYIYHHNVLVADISNEGIIGMDFLVTHDCDVLLSQNKLKIKGEIIQCYHYASSAKSCYRVAIQETVDVPPNSEMIVSGESDEPIFRGLAGLIEPNEKFMEKNGLLVARSIVHPEMYNIPLRIINLNKEPCTLYKEYSSIFSKSSEDIGLTDLVEHTINTGNHPPVRQRPRRIPLARMKDAEAEIQKMVKQDIIEPSTSPWNSNIVLVKKSDGSWRFCIDFRAVNLLVLRPSYPLPRIDDTIDSLSGSKFFSTVDLKSGYYQIPVAKEDRPKTAFSFPGGGLWQFKRMPMGLCNSAPVFEQLMETVLSAKPMYKVTEKNQKFVWTEECQQSFEELKTTLISAPILAYPTREDLFILDTDASNVGMGAVLSQLQDGVEKVICYFSKTFSRSERKYCVTRRELLAVVASIKHFHHYLYGKYFKVRSDHGALSWLFNFKNPEGQLARWFEVLASYDFKIEHRAGRSHNNADALSRRPCYNKECPHCARAEINYELVPTHKNVLTVEKCNDNVTIRESCRNVQDVSVKQSVTTTSISCKNEDWPNMTSDEIMNLESKIVRVCTRSKDYGCSQNEKDDPVKEINFENVSESQLSDDVISIIIQWKIDEVKPIWADVSHMSPEVKFYWSRLNSLILVNGILYRKWESYNGKHYDLHIVLPANFKRFVLNQVHNTVTGGHLGVRKTLSKIKQRYFWYKMRQDVKFWCTKCDICASKKAPCKKPKAPMKQYLVGAPWERMAIDILGPLPISVNKNRYLRGSWV